MSAIKRGNPTIASYLATSHADESGNVLSLENVISKLGTSVDSTGNSILHNCVEQPELIKFLLASDTEGLLISIFIIINYLFYLILLK